MLLHWKAASVAATSGKTRGNLLLIASILAAQGIWIDVNTQNVQGKVWKMLVDLELEHNNLDGAVEVFGKSLLQCYNVPLWMSYMDFIKKVRLRQLICSRDQCV